MIEYMIKSVIIFTAIFSLQLVSLKPAMAKGTGDIFISTEKDHKVIVLDGKTLKQKTVIKTSDRPRALMFNPERTLLYVACGDGDAIDVIDVTSHTVIDKLDVGEDPEMFDISPDGKWLYASNEEDAQVTVFDLKLGKKVAEIEVGEEPEGVMVSHDGSTVFVTSEVANMVHLIDTESREVKSNIVVGNRPRRFALTPDGQQLWVTNELSGELSIIDLTINKLIGTLKFNPRGFRDDDISPVGIIMTRDGKRIYVSLGRANHVAVVDVNKRKVEKYILVGRRAWGVALSRDEKILYVTNGMSDDMAILDTEKLKVIRSVPVGRVPHSVVVDD